jgi:hypothetical protein
MRHTLPSICALQAIVTCNIATNSPKYSYRRLPYRALRHMFILTAAECQSLIATVLRHSEFSPDFALFQSQFRLVCSTMDKSYNSSQAPAYGTCSVHLAFLVLIHLLL